MTLKWPASFAVAILWYTKSCREFSALAIDQAHEQANALIKGDGGAIGVTEDSSALRRWMVAGPEVSHLVAEYEVLSGAKDATRSTAHHERTISAQRVFLEKVGRLTKVIYDLGNPFQEESNDLLTLDTKEIAHTSVHELVSTHYVLSINPTHSSCPYATFEAFCLPSRMYMEPSDSVPS